MSTDKTTKIIRSGDEYFLEEDGGAYCWTRARSNARRMTEEDAEWWADRLGQFFGGVEIENAA